MILPPRRRQRGFIINPYAYGGGGGPPPASDPDYASVLALLHFDGANDGTTFTDNSSLAASYSRTGTCVTSTAQSKWGTASLLCATSSNIESATAATTYGPGSSNFTLEAWIYPTSIANVEKCIASQWESTTRWFFGLKEDKLNFYWNGGNFQTASVGISNNAWHHVAVTRSGTDLRYFADGAQLGSAVAISGSINTPTGSPFTVGGQGPNVAPFVGYIDDFRYTLGVARYTGSYTVPTAAFPDS